MDPPVRWLRPTGAAKITKDRPRERAVLNKLTAVSKGEKKRGKKEKEEKGKKLKKVIDRGGRIC